MTLPERLRAYASELLVACDMLGANDSGAKLMREAASRIEELTTEVWSLIHACEDDGEYREENMKAACEEARTSLKERSNE